MALLLAAAKKKKQKRDVFVLAIQQPLSGENAVAGQSVQDAARLFVDQRNKAGGFLGKQIKLVSYDEQSTAEEAVKVANRIVDIDKADVVIGSLISSNLFASGRIFDEAKTPVFGIGFSPSWMNQGWKYIYRANMNTDVSIPSLVRTVYDMGIRSVAIIRGEDDSSITGSDAFVRAAEPLGMRITTITSHAANDTDFSGQIAAMLATNPDTIYLSTFNYVVGTFMRQVRGFGYRNLILSKEVFTIDQIQVAQQHANDFIFVAPYVTYPTVEEAVDPQMRQMLADYLAAFGKMPQHDCAFRAWDAMLALEAAIKIANSTEKSAIGDAVFKVKDLKVLGGTLDFTRGSGEGMHFVPTFIIQDMKYIPVQSWLDAGGYERFKAQL